MEKKDMGYLAGAVALVLILAVLIDPLLSAGTLAFPLSINAVDEDGETPASDTPRPTLSATSPAPRPHSWDGEVTVLHFLEDLPAPGTPDIPRDNITPTPTLRIFIGNSTVTAANPVIPADKPSIPEESLHTPTLEYRGQINTSTIYEKTYVLRYNSVAFLATVVKPPLVIEYTTTPTSDPLYLNNPHYCFMTLTVRNPETMTILTEEGYNRIYSTDTHKVITLYRSGSYHVTLYGNMVQVRVDVKAGI